MSALSHDDLLAVLELIRSAYAFDGVDGFRSELLTALRAVVPGDVLGYNETDLESGRIFAVFDPPEANTGGIEEAWRALAHQHPGVLLAQQGDTRPNVLSNLLTVRELHRSALYQEVYRPLHAEDQLFLTLTEPAWVTIAINRSRRTFTARDRDVIAVAEPHLRQAYVQAQQRERARRIIDAQNAGLDQTHAGLLLLDPTGAVVHASPMARQLLADYFPGRHEVDGVLPSPVADWLDTGNVDHPHLGSLTTPRGRLQIRVLSGRTPDRWRTVLIDEEPATAQPTTRSLRRLGLTNRQAEVLCLLTTGASTQHIADQLTLSPATVRKHLENIYSRLNTTSRAQAVAIALQPSPPIPTRPS